MGTTTSQVSKFALVPLLAVFLLVSCTGDVFVAAPAQDPAATSQDAAPGYSAEPTAARPAASAPDAGSAPAAQPTTPASLAVPFDLGDAVLMQGETVPERFGQMPVRLSGLIAAPPAGDHLPVAVIIHGSHGTGCSSENGMTEDWPCPATEKRHYEGFAYLLDALARKGYVALAINANPAYAMAYGAANTPARMPVLFDLYMERLAAANRGSGAGFGVDLKGRLDLSRLAVLGHSQGGAGANFIMKGRALRTSREEIDAGLGPIGAAVLLAPYGSGEPEGQLSAPSAVILPACDRDIGGLDGQDYYERQRLAADSRVPVVSVLLKWANHNRFNTTLEDEWLANGSEACAPANLLAPEDQRNFLIDFVPRFFDYALRNDTSVAASLGLDPAQPAPAVLCGRDVMTSLVLPSAQRLALDLRPAGGSGSAHAVDCLQEFSPGAPGIEACRRLQMSQPTNPPMLAVSWQGEGGSVVAPLPGGKGDLTYYGEIHVRAAVDPLSELNPHDQHQAFSVLLTDETGRTARVPVADEPALAFPVGSPVIYADRPDRINWDNNLLLGSIRVPLAKFAGIDLSDVRSVALAFDVTPSGAIFVTDLELLRTP